MKSGPAPKPDNVRWLDGKKSRHNNPPVTLRPSVEIPQCPEHLSQEAAAEWGRISELLLKYSLVTDIDTAALALYCQSYGRWQQAEAKIKKLQENGGDGLIIKSPSGYPIQNPYLAIANRAMEDCYKYLQQFGLSPSARTRVNVISVQGELFPDEGKSYFT